MLFFFARATACLPLLQPSLTQQQPTLGASPASGLSQSSSHSTGLSSSLNTRGIGHFSTLSAFSSSSEQSSAPIDSKGAAADTALVERVLRESAAQTEEPPVEKTLFNNS